ncbi:NAD(+)/NADH kinase [Eubacteriales bacterium OttesenSCG-928-N13]|nr:NAD(+)/NADH kinase [Eubacteriales bacterium OttesenSCG-928-N13]
MNDTLRKIGIWYNASKPGVQDVVARLVRAWESHGAQCVAASPYGMRDDRSTDCFIGCELLCVVGGDGTLLSALDVAYEQDLSLLGVNMGRMGFLSEVQPDHLEMDIDQLVRGDYEIQPRMLLSASLEGGRGVALNEVAISRTGSASGILSIEIEAGGILVDRFSGDGVIVASATGSTAYSLSAGGPIVAPGMECMVITPVCPHTLHARPVVIPPDQPVTVRMLDAAESARVVLDGRRSMMFDEQNGQLTITRAPKDIRFVQLHQRNFFDLLRNKLSDWTH